MENRITAFINKRISLYNNVRIPKPMIPTIIRDTVFYLDQFLKSEFAEFGDSFKIENNCININSDDEKLAKRIEEFYNIFSRILLNNKQTEIEIQKYGSHSEIYNAVRDRIISLYETIRY